MLTKPDMDALLLTKQDMDALLQEALTIAGGDMEIVARAALREMVKLKIEKTAQSDTATETVKKRRGRPSKPGLRVPKEYQKPKRLGAPPQTGLSVPTKECGEMALSIQKHGVTVSDSPITEVKPHSDKEAAKRTLQMLDLGWILEDSVKHEAKIKNVAKRMSEVRSRKDQ